MGPIKDWITNPDVGLGFNIARAGISAGAGLVSRPPKQQTFDVYSMLEPSFNQALSAQQRVYDMEAADMEAQAQIAEQESAIEAERKAREVDKFAQEQENQYNASGIIPSAGIVDSRLLVIDETRRLGQQEIDALKRRGQATADLLRRRAAIGSAQGKASLLGEQTKFSAQRAQSQIVQTGQAARLQQSGASDFLSSLFGGLSSQKVPRAKQTPLSTGTPQSSYGNAGGFLTPMNPKI